MIEDGRLRNLADTKFRATPVQRPPVQKISRIRNRLLDGRWSTREVLRILNNLYNELSGSEREIIKTGKQDLEQLRKEEKNEKKKIRRAFSAINDETPPTSIPGYSNFAKSYIFKKKYNQRKEVADELLNSLTNLESAFTDSSFDTSTLEYAVENDDEELALEELGSLYQHLLRKGWHNRDIFESLARGMWSGNFLEQVNEVVNKSREEATFVCYVSGIYLEHPLKVNSYVKRIIPSEDLSIDRLGEEYPYGKNEFNYVQPDVQKLLDDEEVGAVIIEIEQYGQFGATETAKEKLSTVLDAFSFAETRGDLEDPHLVDWFQYTSWRPTDEEASLTMGKTRESSDRAVIPDFRINELENTIFPALELDSNTNNLADVFERGLHQFRRGNTTNRQINKIIEYISCLETIADPGNTQGDERIENIQIVGGLQDHLETDRIRSALRARNDAVHSGISRSDLEIEVRLFRAALRSALLRLANFALERDGGTVQDFVEHCERKNDDRREKRLKQLSAANIPRNEKIDFTTDLRVDQGDDREDMVVTMSGHIQFKSSEKSLITKLTVLEANADSEGHFTRLHFPELEIQTEYGGISIQLNGLPGWVGSAVSRDVFEYLRPWEAYPHTFQVEKLEDN
jgi:hypothetical protein